MIKEGGTADPDDPFVGLTQLHVVLDWFEELRARVPTNGPGASKGSACLNVSIECAILHEA